MRRTAEEAEATRTALVEAGVLTFAENGFHAARLDDVADRAGVTRGAVYHHFGDKRGLLSAIVDRYIEAFDRSVDETMPAVGGLQAWNNRTRAGAPADAAMETVVLALERLIVEPLALIESDRYAAAFFELVMLRASGLSELEAVRMQRRELMNARMAALSAALRAEAHAGRIRVDIETDAIARHVASVQYGVLATWIEFGRTYSLVEAGKTAARLVTDAIEGRPHARRTE